MEELARIEKILEELRETSSSLKKKEILTGYKDDGLLKQVLCWDEDPAFMFGVSSANCKKVNKTSDCNLTIYELFQGLSDRLYTGHDAISLINGFIKTHGHEDLVYKLLDKNLGTRTGTKIINHVWPGAIVEFDVALADKYEMPCDWENEHWYASRKLDGVRAICEIKDGKASFYSREGQPILTLKTLCKSIEDAKVADCVLDGELCIVKDDVESFQGIMKELHKKDHDIVNAKYFMFDHLTNEEFWAKKGTTILSERRKRLLTVKAPGLSVLPQRLIQDQEHFESMQRVANEENWEGLILRKDVSYQGKRTKFMLKVKKWQDAEYKVVRIETGPFEVVINNKVVKENLMTKVYIVHKNNEVGVGSGWNLEQRRAFLNNPELIMGKVITVKYFEETQNEDGKFSLRFPTVKYVHGDKREL